MMHMRVIILQDAAAILSTNPCRHVHPIFQFEVFNNSTFTTYCNNMKKLLLESVSPVNSSLETVIPGMNTRLTGIQVGLDNNGASLAELEQSVAVGFSTAPQQIETSLKSLFSQFFSVASNHFSLHDDHNDNNNDATFSSPSINTNPVSVSDIDINNNIEQTSIPGLNYRLTSSPTSATAMWNQWYGLLEYKDVPVVGGIPAMEKAHKATWRKYNSKEQKNFSRLKKMIQHMGILKLEKGNDDTFFTEMDGLFLENPKITPFQNTLKVKVRLIVVDST